LYHYFPEFADYKLTCFFCQTIGGFKMPTRTRNFGGYNRIGREGGPIYGGSYYQGTFLNQHREVGPVPSEASPLFNTRVTEDSRYRVFGGGLQLQGQIVTPEIKIGKLHLQSWAIAAGGLRTRVNVMTANLAGLVESGPLSVGGTQAVAFEVGNGPDPSMPLGLTGEGINFSFDSARLAAAGNKHRSLAFDFGAHLGGLMLAGELAKPVAERRMGGLLVAGLSSAAEWSNVDHQADMKGVALYPTLAEDDRAGRVLFQGFLGSSLVMGLRKLSEFPEGSVWADTGEGRAGRVYLHEIGGQGNFQGNVNLLLLQGINGGGLGGRANVFGRWIDSTGSEAAIENYHLPRAILPDGRSIVAGHAAARLPLGNGLSVVGLKPSEPEKKDALVTT
jgi:hypothetical protein